MNRTHDTNAAVAFTSCTTDLESEIDGLIRLACKGDESAAHVAAYELRPRLILDVTPRLPGCEDEAEDVVDEALLALFEGELKVGRGPGQALAAVIRLANSLARQRMRQRGQRWCLDD